MFALRPGQDNGAVPTAFKVVCTSPTTRSVNTVSRCDIYVWYRSVLCFVCIYSCSTQKTSLTHAGGSDRKKIMCVHTDRSRISKCVCCLFYFWGGGGCPKMNTNKVFLKLNNIGRASNNIFTADLDVSGGPKWYGSRRTAYSTTDTTVAITRA